MQTADLINVFITALVYLLLFFVFIFLSSTLYLFGYLFTLSICCKYLFNDALCVSLCETERLFF